MTTFKFSQHGQASTTSIGMAVFFMLYFTFVMILIWMVEGIVPVYLTTKVSLLAVGSALLVIAAMATSLIMEKASSAIIGTPAPVTAWHTIRFSILGVVAINIGYPLFDAVIKSAMFTIWLLAIFIVIPFIAFTIAMYQVIMGGGGGP